MSVTPPALPPRLTADEAKTCLWTNLAAPGLGSWRAGWRISGALQMLLGAGGMGLSLWWCGWFLAEWSSAGKLPMLVIWENEGVLPPGYLRFLLVGLSGLGLFGVALLWGLFTSLLVRAEAARHGTR